MSLLSKCTQCGSENVGGDKETKICHRCRDSKPVEEETKTETAAPLQTEANQTT